jgi:hypothetical protein
MSEAASHISAHADPNIAYHVEWGFRKEALIGVSDVALGVNLHPIATEFRGWLLNEGSFPLFEGKERDGFLSIKNPYTYHASVIASILAQVINATHTFGTSTETLDETQAEIERIRLYNEQVLYTARFCEVTIKQLLYCTQISKKLYVRSALGGLLEVKCRACKAEREHKISLLGSLAHRYHLCIPIEKCLAEHLKIVNRRRNVEAAHSETQSFNIRTAAASRAQLLQESFEVANELVHMLTHISDLEQQMIRELTGLLAHSKFLIRPRNPGQQEIG